MLNNILRAKEWLSREEISESNVSEVRSKLYTYTDIPHISTLEYQLIPSIEVDIGMYKNWKAGISIKKSLRTVYKQAEDILLDYDTRT
jgi:hypothetical protein